MIKIIKVSSCADCPYNIYWKLSIGYECNHKFKSIKHKECLLTNDDVSEESKHQRFANNCPLTIKEE
jgi:hypothetical protein